MDEVEVVLAVATFIRIDFSWFLIYYTEIPLFSEFSKFNRENRKIKLFEYLISKI